MKGWMFICFSYFSNSLYCVSQKSTELNQLSKFKKKIYQLLFIELQNDTKILIFGSKLTQKLGVAI